MQSDTLPQQVFVKSGRPKSKVPQWTPQIDRDFSALRSAQTLPQPPHTAKKSQLLSTPRMSLKPSLSSAQQLLKLAHTQAQQMLSLAYQQAQQVLLNCDQVPQSKPPSLTSVCKAHNRPACSLAPCSQILYTQSKVTCPKLHAKLIEKVKSPKTQVFRGKTQPCKHPSSLTPSLQGEGKHPTIKPMCVIKAQSTCAGNLKLRQHWPQSFLS